MKNEYKQALAEVNIILENTQEEIKNKLPNRFKKFIKENMDNNHYIKIDKNKSLVEQNISKETKEILALIYRDYLCTKEERTILISQEQQEKMRKEKDEQEKYNIDFNKISEKRKQKNIIEKLKEEKQTSLIEISQEKWYKKIINKILGFFKLR